VHTRALPHAGLGEAALVTVSIGLATVVPDGQGGPPLLAAAADKALYRAKSGGRDRWVLEEVQA
jgi:PleD family two-component response regulator